MSDTLDEVVNIAGKVAPIAVEVLAPLVSKLAALIEKSVTAPAADQAAIVQEAQDAFAEWQPIADRFTAQLAQNDAAADAAAAAVSEATAVTASEVAAQAEAVSFKKEPFSEDEPTKDLKKP